MDSSASNTTRMEAVLCKSVSTTPIETALATESAELVITDDNREQTVDNLCINEKKPALDDQSNIKLKRCRHGRIIIKDMSKKKFLQNDDREPNQPNTKTSTETKEDLLQNDKSTIRADSPAVDRNIETTSDPIKLTSQSTELASTDAANDVGPLSESERNLDTSIDKVRDHKKDEVINSRRIKSRSPETRRSRSRTSPRKRIINRSPSHRKSPRRDRDKSPRRRDRSRSPRLSKRSSRRLSSSKRHRNSREESRNSPSRRRVSRRSPRHKSPRRRRSRSRSRSSSRFIGRNSSKSPYREVDGRRRSLRDSSYDRVSRRTNVFDINSSDLNNQLITEVSKAIKSDNYKSSQLIISETLLSKQSLKLSEGQETALSQNNNHNDLQSNQLADASIAQKSSQQEASPKKPLSVRSSLSPSTNESVSSDIYDPEGPIIPLSPIDSPPSFSSKNKTANTKIAYPNPTERNDDDVPSSAVQLNQQEKYLQKLNRQERVVEEVKLALKPHYQKRAVRKDQYKDILRRAVPKICHSKNGEINPNKIRTLVDAYVKKMKRHKV